MITDNDIKKLAKFFATKDDLKRFATKEDLNNFATRDNLAHAFEKFDGQMVEFRNDILDHVDAVYKELKDMREEQSIYVHSQMRQDEKLENHEKRIKKLETASTTP